MLGRTGSSTLARSRWAGIGAAVAVSLGAGGVGLIAHAAGTSTPSSFVAVTPCRLFDTRSSEPIGDRTTPLNADETFVRQVTGANGNCTIPAGATAINYNLTIPNGLDGFLTLYPADAERPNASTINPVTGQGVKVNGGTVGTLRFRRDRVVFTARPARRRPRHHRLLRACRQRRRPRSGWTPGRSWHPGARGLSALGSDPERSDGHGHHRLRRPLCRDLESDAVGVDLPGQRRHRSPTRRSTWPPSLVSSAPTRPASAATPRRRHRPARCASTSAPTRVSTMTSRPSPGSCRRCPFNSHSSPTFRSNDDEVVYATWAYTGSVTHTWIKPGSSSPRGPISTASAKRSIPVGLAVDDHNSRTTGLRSRHDVGSGEDGQRRSGGEEQIALIGSLHRGVDHLGHERLTERNRVALQHADSAEEAVRIILTGANTFE